MLKNLIKHYNIWLINMVELISQTTMRSKLYEPESIEFINKHIESHPKLSQFALAKFLCKKYSFVAPNNTLQVSSCLVVLADLEKRGQISLPKARAIQWKFTPMVLSDNVCRIRTRRKPTRRLRKN